MVAGSERCILVYDVGGSHVSAAICATGGFQLGTVFTAPHSTEPSTEAFLDRIEQLGKDAANGQFHPEGAALAFPGPFDYAAGISLMRHKLPYLYGVDLRTAVAARFGWDPAQVTFVHDASAFLLGEISAGAARGFNRSVGLTLGTGVGSAFAVNGCLVNEGKGVPPGGEIWNLPFDGATIEDAVSSRAIRLAYSRRTGREQEVALLARRATEDPDARIAFHEFGENLGLAMRATLAGFAPQVVVLGGGICRSAELFLPSAQKVVEDLHLDIRISELFERAALVGAAAAWFNSSHGAHVNVLR
jgi:glucokinase